MVRKLDKGNKVFYIQCADWEGFAEAESPEEACSLILSECLKEFKNQTQLSTSMLSIDLSSLSKEGEVGRVQTHPAAQILANVGFHQGAASLKILSENRERL